MADEARDISRANFATSRFHDFCDRNPGIEIHQPISREDPTRLDATSDNNHIPAAVPSNGSQESPMQNMKCCCGRAECAYLEHNNTALGGLEKDLETAARLGQVSDISF